MSTKQKINICFSPNISVFEFKSTTPTTIQLLLNPLKYYPSHSTTPTTMYLIQTNFQKTKKKRHMSKVELVELVELVIQQ